MKKKAALQITLSLIVKLILAIVFIVFGLILIMSIYDEIKVVVL